MKNSLFTRLLRTTTQQDLKIFDEAIVNLVRKRVPIDHPKLNEMFVEGLKKKECCSKCDEVKKIVNPKVTFRMEQKDEVVG